MSAPVGCEIVTVAGLTGDAVGLNGEYQFDDRTQAWINANNVDYSIVKQWWDANTIGPGNPQTSGYRWTIVFDPKGSDPPEWATKISLFTHPTLVGSYDLFATDGWAIGSTAEAFDSMPSWMNPIGGNIWPYRPSINVNITRHSGSNTGPMVDSGHLYVDFTGVEGYAGENGAADGVLGAFFGNPTELQWANYMIGRTHFDLQYSSYQNLADVAPPKIRFKILDDLPTVAYNPRWQEYSYANGWVDIPNANGYYGTFFTQASRWDINRGNFTDYWTVSAGAPANSYDNREFNHIAYPYGPAGRYNFTYDDISNAPLNLTTLPEADQNDIDNNNEDALAGTWEEGGATTLQDICMGVSYALDLGFADAGLEECPADADWTGTGITMTKSSGTVTPGILPGTPSTFTAVFDLGSIVPSTPSAFEAIEETENLLPAAPILTSILVDSDADGPVDEYDDLPLDPTEQVDTDEDGVGDNTDEFPADFTETTDTDGDGVGDNASNIEIVGESMSSWTGWTKPSRFNGWAVDKLSNALTGPFSCEDVTALTSVKNTSDMVCVTSDLKVKSTDLTDLREGGFKEVDIFGGLWNDLTQPVGNDFIVGNHDGAFSYRGRYLTTPFAKTKVGSSTITKPLFFSNAYLSIAETAWMHLGNEHDEKQVHRIDFAFRKNSAGHLWAYVESDEGKVSGQYKGELKEHIKVFTNVRGRRFRIRMFIATHSKYPWNLREMAVGYLVGKSF
tara:strand:- start:10632 stop:12830 length:2199 start_codon:yes stop_codon:yes gene_type:complete